MLRFHVPATWTTAGANFAFSTGAGSTWRFGQNPSLGKLSHLLLGLCQSCIDSIIMLPKWKCLYHLYLYSCPCHQINMKNRQVFEDPTCVTLSGWTSEAVPLAFSQHCLGTGIDCHFSTESRAANLWVRGLSLDVQPYPRS